MEKTKGKKALKVLGIVGNVFLWLFVVFSVLTTVLVIAAKNDKDNVPALFGKSFITIQTNSMTPTYDVGDLVFMEKLSDEEKQSLKAGDIITFHAPIDIDGDGETGDINTHRIEYIENGRIYTKGDNPAATTDQPITYDAVIGKCTAKGKLGGFGGALDFLSSSLGFLLCVVLPMLLFFLYELYSFISLLVARKAVANPVSKETEEEIKRKAIEEYLASQATRASQAPQEPQEPQEPQAPPTDGDTPKED